MSKRRPIVVREGELVRASVAARTLGMTRPTIVAWIQAGRIKGRCVAGRWYVLRSALAALRDVPATDTRPGDDAGDA